VEKNFKMLSQSSTLASQTQCGIKNGCRSRTRTIIQSEMFACGLLELGNVATSVVTNRKPIVCSANSQYICHATLKLEAIDHKLQYCK
jgi:hypothetical protein